MLNKIGEITPPCLTPLPTKKCDEIELPHQTHIFWYVYQKSSSLITNSGTSFSINLSNNSQEFNLSNILLASRNVTYTVVPLYL